MWMWMNVIKRLNHVDVDESEKEVESCGCG